MNKQYLEEIQFDDGYQNEAQRECGAIAGGWFSEEDPKDCGCRGCGWILSDWDVWVRCPLHYKGGPDPETAMEEASRRRDWENAWDALSGKERHEVVCRYARYRLEDVRRDRNDAEREDETIPF